MDPRARIALMDGRDGEPDAVAIDSLAWHVEAEQQAAGLSDSLVVRVLEAVARRVARDQPPVAGQGTVTTFERAIHRHLLTVGERFGLGLDAEALSRLALELADVYTVTWRTEALDARAAAAVRAVDGIPTGALESGVVRLLWNAMTEAEGVRDAS